MKDWRSLAKMFLVGFLLTKNRRPRPDSLPKIAYAYLPCQRLEAKSPWIFGSVDHRKSDRTQGRRRRLCFLGGEEEASMLRRAIGHKSRGLPQWHLIVSQVREYRWTEIDPGVHTREAEHDNPSSG
jgi:hypothetical protein